MNLLADASLPGLTEAFPKPFCLTTYANAEEVPTLLPGQDVLLCRSTLKIGPNLVRNHSLKFIATASSGTDHLDKKYLANQGVQIIAAKGSNATSVADYVQACLAYLDKKGRIKGKQVGIIGMGEVGSKVYSRCKVLGYLIRTFDPLKALNNRTFQSCTLEQLFECDILCIHAELHDSQPYPSVNLINEQFLAQLKPGCIIINAARGGIINEEALINTRRMPIYCTDVYLNEPKVNKQIIELAYLCTPHIAGHSIEAKYAAVAQVSEQLHQLLKLPIPNYAKPSVESSVDNSATQGLRPEACPRDLGILNEEQTLCTLSDPTRSRGQAAGRRELNCQQTLAFSKKISNESSWQDLVLSLYNPIEETTLFKQAVNKEKAFLEIRKNHNVRHDFPNY